MPRIRGFVILSFVFGFLGLAARSEAGPVLPANFVVTQRADGFAFDGQFGFDDDFALIPLTIGFESILDVGITSFLDPEVGGFNPNLFLLNLDGSQAEGLDADGNAIQVNDQDAGNMPLHATIAAGNYVLAVSQQLNLPDITGFTFSQEGSPLYTCTAFGQPENCPGFVDGFAGPFDPADPEGFLLLPRSNEIHGIATITSLEQPVPEPGTLALLATGVGWLASRRGLRRKAGVQARDS
jgi:hypothetical protein